jgi:hypothetical protein
VVVDGGEVVAVEGVDRLQVGDDVGVQVGHRSVASGADGALIHRA